MAAARFPKFPPLRHEAGGLSRLGSGERNSPKAKAREGRTSGSERIIGLRVRWLLGAVGKTDKSRNTEHATARAGSPPARRSSILNRQSPIINLFTLPASS